MSGGIKSQRVRAATPSKKKMELFANNILTSELRPITESNNLSICAFRTRRAPYHFVTQRLAPTGGALSSNPPAPPSQRSLSGLGAG